MALEVKEVGFEFREGAPVLCAVSGAFRAGAVTAVVGPNGAGKSTLLRLLLGVLRPTAGRVELDGAGVWEMPVRERARRIVYIPQKSAPAPGFTVREYVRMGRLAFGAKVEEEVSAALERMELADRADEVVETLSVGQQQRAVMARALAQLSGARSPVLLADEPASALDPAHALRAMGVFREVAKSGATVVIVLHDFSMAERFCDEALVLDREGRIAAHGGVKEVLVPGVLDEVFGVRFVKGAGALVAESELEGTRISR